MEVFDNVNAQDKRGKTVEIKYRKGKAINLILDRNG